VLIVGGSRSPSPFVGGGRSEPDEELTRFVVLSKIVVLSSVRYNVVCRSTGVTPALLGDISCSGQRSCDDGLLVHSATLTLRRTSDLVAYGHQK
jgi:hypothetical protein